MEANINQLAITNISQMINLFGVLFGQKWDNLNIVLFLPYSSSIN